MAPNLKRKIISKIISTGLLASLGLLSWSLKPKPSLAAERLSFSIPIVGEFHLSVESLALFAQDGTITPEFNFYAKRFNPKALARFRQVLQQQFKVEVKDVYRLTNMPMGEKFLKGLGEVIYTHPQRNGLHAIRAALILAAADPEGFTPISVMRHFPTKEIQLDTKSIFSLIRETSNFLSYNDSTVEAIAKQADSEISSQPQVDSQQMTDLRQQGPYSVTPKSITFKINRTRETPVGLTSSYDLNVDMFLPEDIDQPAPLAVISHGFTSRRQEFKYLAEHLASHGYIVVAPEHIGSNSEFKDAFLRGELSVDVSPSEFYSRPLDITYLLNKLEERAEFKKLINWQQVGILGHSFGGNTALIASGAPLNLARITQVCAENKPTLNPSILLQCRARHLPAGEYNLQDPRIKAVVGVNPVTSSVLGPESISQISIPTMLLGGSQDIFAPFIPEQAHPFLSLTTENKYLGIMVEGTHNSIGSEAGNRSLPKILQGPRPDLARSYLKAVSLAFFEVHLRARSDYQPYLSSAYTQAISNEELPFYLVKSLTPEQLEQAYGETPPIPFVPESITAVSPEDQDRIFKKIKDSKTLRIGMRTDAAPFGYIDPEDNLWTGYCEDLADSLGEYLAQKLKISAGIEVVKLPSSLENRFELVRKNTVDLECGPNTIRTDLENISFSDLFFVSGTRFLVIDNNATQVDFKGDLAELQIGVLQDTTTDEFLQANYPQAEVVYLEGEEARTLAVQAVTDGSLDAFVSEDILLTGEIDRQNLAPENYQLIPEEPLACNFYGLILPEGDYQWEQTVNSFIRRQSRQFIDKWLQTYLPQAVDDLDYCLNRAKN